MLFPARCIGCGCRGFLICQRCLASAPRLQPPYCQRCGRSLSFASISSGLAAARLCGSCCEIPFHIEGMRSPYLLTGFMRKAIHEFKYGGVFSLAPVLGKILADYLNESRMPADVVVSVPLHQSRRKERGYDQAELLAESLTKHTGLPLGRGWLVRQRPTLPQVRTASAMERWSNVRAAFAPGPRVERSRTVLLVDDVCTTGATLEACAMALQEAGVGHVWGLTVAREP